MIKNEKDLRGIFFNEKSDSLITTILEGNVGIIWTDTLDNPNMAFATDDTYAYIDGSVTEEFLKQCINETLINSTKKEITIIPYGKLADRLLKKYLENSEDKSYRVSMNKRFLMEPASGCLDKYRLRFFISLLPEHMKLVPIDEELFGRIKEDLEMEFLLIPHSTYEEFSSKGKGFVIMDNDDFVAGAVPYSRFSGGIEVEYMTKKSYRGKGYATIVAAKLLEYCIENEIEAVWDAAHLVSLTIAEKLGYTLAKEYAAYTIKDLSL